MKKNLRALQNNLKLLFISALFICFTSLFSIDSLNVTIAISEWAPYSTITEPNYGFLTEIATTAFNEMGYQVEIVMLPWKRALSNTQNGCCTALLGASYTVERTEHFIYPNYAWESYNYFFARKENKNSYTSIQHFAPAVIGVFRGSFYVKKFNGIPGIKLEEVNTVDQNIIKLLNHRIDYFIDSGDAVNYIMNKNFSNKVNEIKAIQPEIEIDKLYIVISKKVPNYQKIANDFDKGIEIIKKTGIYDEILKKHHIKLEL